MSGAIAASAATRSAGRRGRMKRAIPYTGKTDRDIRTAFTIFTHVSAVGADEVKA
jgi:hypothetical protein